MKTTLFAFVTALAVSATGCFGGDSGSDLDIASETLSGRINGTDWSFAAGHTSAFLSDEETFFASLYAEEFEPCGFSEPSGPHLIVAIPTEPGEHELSLGLNMTFVYDDGGAPQNLVSTSGRIAVDAVDGGKVAGGLAASFDGDNEVTGTFEITICDDE